MSAYKSHTIKQKSSQSFSNLLSVKRNVPEDEKPNKLKKMSESGGQFWSSPMTFSESHQKILERLIASIFGTDSNIYQNMYGEKRPPLLMDYSLAESRSFSYSETETTEYSATANVITADGRNIDVNYSLHMSRSFEAYYQTSSIYQLSGAFMDPLTINLDTNPASISDVHFYFDLDCDGTDEELATLNSGGGFLAYDKNDDGIINDGSELFGALSGDGFADLARYDLDGNGWIDEADDIFSNLRIWVAAGSLDAHLLTLKDAGIGAICLGNVDTDFTLTDVSKQAGAIIRKTGFFLYENGEAGSLQHVDLKNFTKSYEASFQYADES